MFTPTMETIQLKRIVEAALLAAGQPMALTQINDLFGEEEMPGVDAIANTLAELQADCAERGVELVEVASGWRYQIRKETQPWVSRLWSERQTKYSRALLETLALIAYRQPITRAEIEQIRGVAVSTNMVKTLEEREWIRIVGHRDVPGRPALFGTTKHFLDYFNLKNLDELPPLAELRDLSDIEPQLALDPDTIGPLPTAIELADGDEPIDSDDRYVERETAVESSDIEDLTAPAEHAAGIESATTPSEDRSGDDPDAPEGDVVQSDFNEH
ncbi:MAG TPA: SMC-Scp complex subunit ScpB [Pseudomonadota bacterium]|nr:SMC-Scp complex subunit ScpB [Pseudomonadota bacterium]